MRRSALDDPNISDDRAMLATSLQYRFVKALLDFVWICCIATLVWSLVTFPTEQKLLLVPGTILIGVVALAVRLFVFPRIRTLGQLDWLTVATMLPWWIFKFALLLIHPEMAQGVGSILLYMTVAAIVIRDRWLFAGWIAATYSCYLAMRFAVGLPYSPVQSLHIWVLIPATTLLLRRAVASSFDAVFKENLERRATAARLQREQLKLAMVLQQAPLILCVLDADGNYLKSRGSGLSALGVEPDEIVGRNYRAIFADHPPVVQAIASALNGTHARAHARFGKSHYEIRYRPVQDPADGPEAVIGVGIEVTEQIQLAEREKQDERDLLHSQKLQSLATLAGGVAHDFNNYLTSIVSCCETLLRAESDAMKGATATIELIKSTALKAAGLSKQMLIYGGKDVSEDEQPGLLDLATILEGSKGLLEAQLPNHAEMKFSVDTENDLPVKANEVLLDQVILNVFKNSIDALPKSGGLVEISLEPFQMHLPIEGRVFGQIDSAVRYWQLECRDNGCGIAPDQLDCVLDLYYTTKSTGSGIGLAVTATIMQRFDGAIVISSERGVGTTVRLLLPIADEEHNSTHPKSDLPSIGDRKSRKIMLVDDNEAVLSSMAKMLRATGAETFEATSGEQAIDEMRRGNGVYDCIILDYSMPRMNGLETLQRIRALNDDTPVVMCSGFTLEIEGNADVQYQPELTLLKPCRLDQLLDAIDSITLFAQSLEADT